MVRQFMCLWLLLLLTGSAAQADPTVAVAGGAIRGQESDHLVLYKGIPFAAPPVGRLRWRPPEPPKSWKGVRECVDFGPMCPQITGPLSGTGPQSEDCLYLNVWAPPNARSRPVMVWFHGGGNMRGSDRLSYYDGSSLAHHNVVVVTAQYRVGILGFLALPELIAESPHHSAGNYGLLDQIQALRWVQQNIAQFGGDPHRITAFGESSGAADIACMMTSPLARGAMQQAIMESGSAYYDIADLKTAAAHGTEVESKLGLTSLAALRGASAEQLLHSGAAFDTIVDGWILPEFPATAWQEHHVAPLPVIIGTNHDEGSAQPNPPSTVADYEERLKYIFGALYPEALQIFPCTEDEQATATIDRVLTTVQYAAPARRAARTLQAAGDTHVYRYLFSKIPPGRVGEVLGAGHGTELAYVFGSFRRPIEEHVALSNIMQEAWTQFAATSDPSTASVPWPAYQADTDEVLEFGDTVAVKSGWLRAECDLADKRP